MPKASVKNFPSLHTTEDFTVNKQLVKFKEMSPFYQDILTKPEKYGMKVLIFSNVKTSHTLNLKVTQL
jgi:hypothetical protein